MSVFSVLFMCYVSKPQAVRRFVVSLCVVAGKCVDQTVTRSNSS